MAPNILDKRLVYIAFLTEYYRMVDHPISLIYPDGRESRAIPMVEAVSYILSPDKSLDPQVPDSEWAQLASQLERKLRDGLAQWLDISKRELAGCPVVEWPLDLQVATQQGPTFRFTWGGGRQAL